MKILVRFLVYYLIKTCVSPFHQIPANSFKFYSCDCYPQVEYLRVNLKMFYIFNTHNSRYGLPGSQILFDNHTLVPQRQY